jgi:hypothetical protein
MRARWDIGTLSISLNLWGETIPCRSITSSKKALSTMTSGAVSVHYVHTVRTKIKCRWRASETVGVRREAGKEQMVEVHYGEGAAT